MTDKDTEKKERIQRHLQNKIEYLSNLNESYKDAIDKCDPASISSLSMTIAFTEKGLEDNKDYLTKMQEEEIDDLKREYAYQFQRLNIYKVCECKPK